MHAFFGVAAAATPSPSPSVSDFQRAVEEWPEPPRWLYIALAVVVVLLVLLVVATAATTIASWSTRKKGVAPPRTTEWVDLSTIDTRKSGVDRHTVGTDAERADGGDADTESAKDNEKPEG